MKLCIIYCAMSIALPAQACSIVGYLGKNLCKPFILQGLSRLEYRGYDSAGFACFDRHTGQLVTTKSAGKLDNLKNKLKKDHHDGFTGIGHTRWATHGEANEVNAHPHLSNDRSIAVVHNGIIENFAVLKDELQAKGYEFISDTDTETIAHLFSDRYYAFESLRELVIDVTSSLQGAYGCLVMLKEYPHTLVAIRKGSPICIGLGDQERFVASDFLAFAGNADEVIFLPDESFAIITKEDIEIYDFSGTLLSVSPQKMNVKPSVYEKFEHEHFMLKEIFEQKMAIARSVDAYRALGDGIWNQLGMTKEQVREIKRINLFGCGTSWHAARIAQFYFETICKIPTHVHLASEFRYMPFFEEEDTMQIAISQSGETADTLEAIRLITSHNMPIVAITNVPSSSMVRETTGHLLTYAGPEIAVASTKAFSTQLAALYWLAHYIAYERELCTHADLERAGDDLLYAAQILEEMIDQYKLSIIQTHAKRYAKAQRFMFLGRHIEYPFAMEAALKLKEISYIFAMGYPAGELKHGSIALIDMETPVVFFSHIDPLIYQKLVVNAQEVKARKGHLLSFVFEGQEELRKLSDHAFIMPRVAPLLAPLAMTGLMQFFVYQIAKELGCDIDKPRNLAKAVTVE